MADKVVQRLSTNNESVSNIGYNGNTAIQTKCDFCEEEEKLQKKDEPLANEINSIQLKPIFESNTEQPETNIQAKPISAPVIQLKCATCSSAITSVKAGEQEEKLQMKEEEELSESDTSVQTKSMDTPSDISSNFENRLNSSKGGGSSLTSDVQNSMGSEFGADFSGVKVHTGSEAVQMSSDIGAQAFTHGNDIYFNEGKYDTNSTSGKHLLAHELTHTVQQGKSVQTKKDPENTKKSYSKDGSPTIQRAWYNVDIPFTDYQFDPSTEGLRNAANITSNAVSGAIDSGIETVRETGADFIRTTLNRIAPGLYDLLVNGIDADLKQRIFQSIMRVVRVLKTRIENSDLVGKIREFFSTSKIKLKQWNNDVSSGCNSLYEKMNAIVSFLGEIADPVIQQIRQDLETIGQYASGFWNSFGKPAWDAIRELAGDAWSWLESTARWIWDQTSGIRGVFIDIWDWIKTQLGLLQDSAASIWDRFKEIASEVWNDIKSYIEPILQPLKVLGGLMLMLGPLGPIVAIYQSGPRIWESLKWIVTNWSGWQTLIDFKEYFANDLLPAISSGAQLVKQQLGQAVEWINSIVTSVKQAVKDFLDSLGILQVVDEIRGFMAELRQLFNEIKAEFESLVNSLKEEFNAVLTLVKSLLNAIWECVKPIFDFVLGIVILALNPYYWPIYATALIARLAWYFLPRSLKIVAIDYIIQLLRSAVVYLRPTGIQEQIWSVYRSGATSFLDRLVAYSPDEKIHFVDKILNLIIDPRTYGAYMRGLIGGFLHQAWTLISGVISLNFSMPGIIKGIIGFFKNLVPDMAMVERMLDRITEISDQIQELLNRENLLEHIMTTIMNSPQALADWIAETTESASEFAETTGRNMAEQLFNFVGTMSNSAVGYKIGDIIGRILFEVLLTKGIGFVIGKMVQGIAWLRRIFSLLRSGARSAATGLLQKVKALFSWIMQRLRALFQGLSEALGRLFASFKQVIDDIIAWIMRALRRGGQMLGDVVQNRLRWELFERRVSLFTSSHHNLEGYRKRIAKTMFSGVFTGFRDVARMPLIMPIRTAQDDEHVGFWELHAVKKFGINQLGTHVVGYLPMRRSLVYEENPVIGLQDRINDNGERHRFIIEGDLRDPELVVRSRRQILIRLLRRRRDELNDSDTQEENVVNKRQVVTRLFEQENDLESKIGEYKRLVDGIYSRGVDRTRSSQMTDKYDEVRVLVDHIGDNLEIVGIDPNNAVIETQVNFTMQRGRARLMRAQPLTKIPPGNGIIPSRPIQDPLGFDLIDSDLRRRGLWVRAHLLSHRIHGLGTRNNLFPGSKQMNEDYMRDQVETPLRTMLWNQDRIMYYTVGVTYGNIGVFEDIPTAVSLEYGDFDSETGNRTRIDIKRFHQDPPDTVAPLNSLNNSRASSLNQIASDNGYTRMGDFFSKLVRERRNNGNYVDGDFDDIKDRLKNSNLYSIESILDGHISNLERMVIINRVLIF